MTIRNVYSHILLVLHIILTKEDNDKPTILFPEDWTDVCN